MSQAIYNAYRSIVAALAAHGVPKPSKFWQAEARRFYLHPSAKQHVVCAGRGGDKSRESCIESIADVTAGTFNIAPGERHYYTHVSENVAEAAKTLGVLEQYLRILRIPHTRTGDTIELTTMPRGWKVLACRVGAVSGWRCIGWTADECAKWSNDGVDPTAEVIASVKAMTVTHPEVRGRVRSSPLASTGFFYDAWAKGDTASQLTAQAATWVANDSVTEAQTRELEPDERVWRREYAAIPQAGTLGAFDPDAIARAFRRRDLRGAWFGQPVVVIDASSGRKDAWTWGSAQWVQTHEGRFLLFEDVDGTEGSFWKSTGGAEIVRRIVNLADDIDAKAVHGDQRESLMLASEFRKHGVLYRVHDWTAVSKPAAVERVRRWFREEAICLPEHERMKRELHAFEERVTSSGAFTFGARGSGHDDYVALILTAAMADAARQIPPPRAPGEEGEQDLAAPPITTYASTTDGWCGSLSGAAMGGGLSPLLDSLRRGEVPE